MTRVSWPAWPPPPELVFELERGDAGPDGEAGGAGGGGADDGLGDAPPQVWRLDEASSDATLARRFKAEWADWYGPELSGAAARIARLLARGSAPSAEAAAHRDLRSLPVAWIMPLVRRRRRQLAIWLRADPARRPDSMAQAPTHRGPDRRRAGAQLVLDMQLIWGATSKPGVPSGTVVWQPCELREQLPGACVAWPCAGDAQLLLARQLRGGVGLLVLRASLQSDAEGEAPPA